MPPLTRCEMDQITEQTDEVTVVARWHIEAPRASVYAVVSDFEALPANFPRLARSAKILSRKGNQLRVEAEAVSFGRLFPRVNVAIDAELLPDHGYRCSTINRTFNTTGREQLLLNDSEGGTDIEYKYVVTVKRKWLRPLYGWLVRTFGLPYWRNCYLQPLTKLAQQHGRQQNMANNGVVLTGDPLCGSPSEPSDERHD